MARGLSQTSTHTRSPPGCHVTLSRVPVLCSRFLLAIHLKYSSVYMSILNSLTIPFPHMVGNKPYVCSLSNNHFVMLKFYGLGFQVGHIGDGWLISAPQCLIPHCGWLRWMEVVGMLSWGHMSWTLVLVWFLDTFHGIYWGWNVQDGLFTCMDWDVWDIWEWAGCLSMQPLHLLTIAWQSQDGQASYMLPCFP